jgi:hypothetical protein
VGATRIGAGPPRFAPHFVSELLTERPFDRSIAMKSVAQILSATAVIMCIMAASARAQYYTTYYYPTTTYYPPATVYYAPAPTAYYAPAPTTVYYAPTVTTYSAVAPTTVYYHAAPPAVAYYRPLVGRAITRVGYSTPAVVYPAATTYRAYYPWW